MSNGYQAYKEELCITGAFIRHFFFSCFTSWHWKCEQHFRRLCDIKEYEFSPFSALSFQFKALWKSI